MKDLDKILLIISIAIFIVVLIIKLVPGNPLNKDISPLEIKQNIEKSLNSEIGEDNIEKNKININAPLNKNENNRGPYPPFVEFVE